MEPSFSHYLNCNEPQLEASKEFDYIAGVRICIEVQVHSAICLPGIFKIEINPSFHTVFHPCLQEAMQRLLPSLGMLFCSRRELGALAPSDTCLVQRQGPLRGLLPGLG